MAGLVIVQICNGYLQHTVCQYIIIRNYGRLLVLRDELSENIRHKV